MDEHSHQQQISSDRTLETLCHLLGLALFTGVPFANVLAPLILWLWKRDGNPSVDAHGKEVLNFQISYSLYLIVSGLLMFVLVGFVLFPIVLIAQVALTIIGALSANRGEFYRYPLTFRLLT